MMNWGLMTFQLMCGRRLPQLANGVECNANGVDEDCPAYGKRILFHKKARSLLDASKSRISH